MPVPPVGVSISLFLDSWLAVDQFHIVNVHDAAGATGKVVAILARRADYDKVVLLFWCYVLVLQGYGKFFPCIVGRYGLCIGQFAIGNDGSVVREVKERVRFRIVELVWCCGQCHVDGAEVVGAFFTLACRRVVATVVNFATGVAEPSVQGAGARCKLLAEVNLGTIGAYQAVEFAGIEAGGCKLSDAKGRSILGFQFGRLPSRGMYNAAVALSGIDIY